MSLAGGERPYGLKPLSMRRPNIVSVLDIGTSKIACMIARLVPRLQGDILPRRTHTIEVMGFGMQRSRGIRAGMVANLDQAEQAIRLAVDAAERMAGVTVESLIVNVSCGKLRSELFSASLDLKGREVVENDIARVLSAARGHIESDGRMVVHALPVGFSLDGVRGVREPKGMACQRLTVNTHVVSADRAPARNLEICINRAHLEVETMVATAYAAGLSVLVEDEDKLGVAVIDMGGGSTTMAVFSDEEFVFADGIGIGGQHVTLDLAKGHSLRLAEAERLKTLHGTVIAGESDERELITLAPVGQEADGSVQLPRSAIVQVIRPRLEEILEEVRDRLAQSGFTARTGRRLVLTGGASQLTGIADLARRIIGPNVRLGRPVGIAGLPDMARGAAFAAVVGLLIYPQVTTAMAGGRRTRQTVSNGGYLTRVGQWFRESF